MKRDFTATAPNQLWVTDLTFLPTWASAVCESFSIDAHSRTIVGSRVASNMKTETVVDSIEMARWSRNKQLAGLRFKSDASILFTSIGGGERLAGIGAIPSIGNVADSVDHALAQTVSGYFKAEIVMGPPVVLGPGKPVTN